MLNNHFSLNNKYESHQSKAKWNKVKCSYNKLQDTLKIHEFIKCAHAY